MNKYWKKNGSDLLARNAGVIKLPSDKKDRFHRDLLLMLVLPAVMSWYYNGASALRVLVVSTVSAVLCEIVAGFIMKLRTTPSDFSAACAGAVLALMLPADISPWIAAAGSAFAIVVAKLPFGSAPGRLPFVPAAAGFVFICLCFPRAAFDYPPIDFGSTFASSDGSGMSLASMLVGKSSLRLNAVSFIDILVGHVPGPMGATSVLVLATSGAFLVFRQPRCALNSVGFIAACALWAALFPRVQTGIGSSVVYELCSGVLIFAAIFLVTDPAGSPKPPVFRLMYGAWAGILCMALRYFGAYEEGACFAVMLACASWPLLEGFFNKQLLRLGAALAGRRAGGTHSASPDSKPSGGEEVSV